MSLTSPGDCTPPAEGSGPRQSRGLPVPATGDLSMVHNASVLQEDWLDSQKRSQDDTGGQSQGRTSVPADQQMHGECGGPHSPAKAASVHRPDRDCQEFLTSPRQVDHSPLHEDVQRFFKIWF